MWVQAFNQKEIFQKWSAQQSLEFFYNVKIIFHRQQKNCTATEKCNYEQKNCTEKKTNENTTINHFVASKHQLMACKIFVLANAQSKGNSITNLEHCNIFYNMQKVLIKTPIDGL